MKRIAIGLLAAMAAVLGAGAQMPGAPARTVSKLEMEVVYLETSGCFPAQISRPVGQQFRLLVVNKSGNPNVQISLQDATQAAQSAKQFSGLDARWLQLITLPAGTYALTSAGPQKFGCTLTLK